MSDQILYAFGSGRDPQTKFARRLDRFADRTFRIGSDVVVRPGRRTEVTVKYLKDNLEMVIEHMDRGALRLQSHSDRFIDKDELRAIVNGEPFVRAAPTAPPGPGENDDTPDGTEIPDEPDEPTPEPEAAPVVEEKSDAELADEPDPTPADAPVEEEPDASPEEDLPPVLDAAPAAVEALPEGWRSRSKKGLLALAQEHKLEVTDKMSNRELIAAIEKLETR
jgi:hypothetical protein